MSKDGIVKPKEQEELIIAKEITNKVDLMTDPQTGIVYRKSNNVYKEMSSTRLDDYIMSEFVEGNIKYSRNKRNTIIDFLKHLTIVYDNLKANLNTVNLLNGVYYLDREITVFAGEDGYIQSHFRAHPVFDYYSTVQLPINYDKNAECPNIDKFIAEVFGEDKVDLVYEFIGYLLLPTVKYQRALILVGSGKNGKTTFLDMLIHFLGLENISQTPLQNLEDRFALWNLKDKVANIVSDLPDKELRDTGNAKRIVTDYTLSSNIKNIQGDFTFINRCKMLYSVNKLPRTNDKSSAFFRRWLMFICSNSFDGREDVNMLDKLTTQEELSGLFNRAIDGIERLKARGGFPDTEAEVKQIWESETNPIAVFMTARCEQEIGEEIKSVELFKAINEFRSFQGLPLLDGRQIGYWLRQYGVVGYQRRDEDDVDKYGNPRWYTFYQNIKFKEPKLTTHKRTLDTFGREIA